MRATGTKGTQKSVLRALPTELRLFRKSTANQSRWREIQKWRQDLNLRPCNEVTLHYGISFM